MLFAPGTQEPVAVIDGAALTALRTAAVSGLATRRLAREDSSHLVVFGAGTQARSHVAAMRAVRPIARVTVVSRTPGPAQALVDAIRADGIAAATAPGGPRERAARTRSGPGRQERSSRAATATPRPTRRVGTW